MNSPSKARLDFAFPVTLLAGFLLGGTTVFYSWTGSTSIFSYIAYHILGGGVAYRGLLTLPLAVAYLLAVRAMSEDRYWRWMAAGFLVGVAALFKLPFGLAAPRWSVD
jgi:hypothetical protein